MHAKKNMKVGELDIVVFEKNKQDFISLTDMARYRDPIRSDYIIQNWLRTRNGIEFCGIWEQVNNPDFNSIEFDGIKNESGSNSFVLTPSNWVKKTGAIGIYSKTGRYGGGTFAHKDIAFEFGTWLSSEFKLYLIREFQRLKEEESSRHNLEWNFQRHLAKVNYRIHTDAIKTNLILLTCIVRSLILPVALFVILCGTSCTEPESAPDIMGKWNFHHLLPPPMTNGKDEQGLSQEDWDNRASTMQSDGIEFKLDSTYRNKSHDGNRMHTTTGKFSSENNNARIRCFPDDHEEGQSYYMDIKLKVDSLIVLSGQKAQVYFVRGN